ncbi:hypothetical protein LCGC14_1382180 [marine sediment metagenome]|uniref:Uncharacterized protein n=1 Tax=marine sediment metagenome TaxID=412755 RepID=A0A0F9MHT2_9ZZZZ
MTTATIKAKLKADANYKCSQCGSADSIHAHHRIPHDDNTMVVLCAECHSREHPNMGVGTFVREYLPSVSPWLSIRCPRCSFGIRSKVKTIFHCDRCGDFLTGAGKIRKIRQVSLFGAALFGGLIYIPLSEVERLKK